MKRRFKWQFKTIAALVAAALIFPPAALGITPAEEKKLSRKFMEVVKREFEFVTDTQIVGYVNRVGQKIVDILPPQSFRYRFFVIKEDSYNAFAGPGGVIFMHSGLIEAMDSESELAGILGHEISHVTCRHLSDRIKRSKKISAISVAGMLAAIALGAAGAGQAAQAAAVGSAAAGQSISLSYSREDEMQADQLGLGYLNEAGYPVDGLLTVLNKIKSKRWFGPDEIPAYLMTHPAVEERLAYISSWEATHAEEASRLPAIDEYEFLKTKTRLAALYGDEDTVSLRFRNEIVRNPGNMMAQYGYGLILARTGHPKEALDHLRKALEKRAFDADLLIDLGRVYFAQGDYQTAVDTLEGALSMAPDQPDGMFYSARSYQELGQLQKAVETFEALLAVNPGYSEAQFFLGRAYAGQGRQADAHYHLGAHYGQKGDYKRAIMQLEKALSLTQDAGKREKINALLADIRGKLNELRQQKAKKE